MRIFILLCVVGLIGLWVVTRSWFIVAQITPELERRLGGKVSIGSAVFDWDGAFVIEDVVLRSPVHEGTAGEIARIGRAVVAVDLNDLLALKVNVLAVDLHDVLLRISEDANENNRFAFDALQTDWSDADPARTRPPRIEIHPAILEYGTHDGSRYEMQGQRHVAGVMHPAVDDEPQGNWYNFLLGEVSPTGGAREQGLLIRGRWNAETHRYVARMDGMELNESTYNMCPQVVRTWWDHMDLEGSVARAVVQWDAQTGLEVAAEILDVGMTLPVQPGEWARYHEGRIIGASGRQRMQVNSGTIRLQHNELMLDTLVGELTSPDGTAGVPYTVTMHLPQLPEANWVESGGRDAWLANVRDFTPFHVRFQLPEFRIEPDEHGNESAVDLPLPVAEGLQRFSIKGWTISTTIEISRREAVPDDSGNLVAQPIEIAGDLSIRNASGSFDKFPYPLSGVDAYLTFTQDGVQVEYVTGTSPNGAAVHIAGEIAPLGRNPRIDLRLTSSDAPIDELLRDALPEMHTAVFDGLLHEPSYRQLREAGLLIDEAKLASLHTEREQLLLAGAEGEDDSARQRLRQLDAMIEAGVFELGGRVDLDIRIHREQGPGHKTQLSGEIAVRRIDAIIQHFPYPFSIRGGVIRWGPDGATLVGDDDEVGLPVITQGGGRGHIRGSFLREQRDGQSDLITPDVQIEVAGDTVTELVYAAIPGREDDENHELDVPMPRLSQSARLLRAIGLAGPMHYRGSIRRNEAGKVGYEFNVHLVDGTAQPTGDLTEVLGSAGLVWPTTWQWDDVNLHVRVSPQAVELVDFTGTREGSRVAAAGVLDLRSKGADASLDVRFSDLAIDRYLLDLFPAERADRAQVLWDTYQPQGSFNAQLQFHLRDKKALAPRLFIQPTSVSALFGEERVTLTHSAGGLSVYESQVTFDNLQLLVQSGDTSDGRLAVDGTYRGPRGGGALVQADWHDGRIESPLVGEVLRLAGAAEHEAQLRKLKLQGLFDADVRLGSADGNGNAKNYEILLRPKSIAAMAHGQQLNVQLSDQSSVRFTPGRIDLQSVQGTHESGTFQLSGNVRLDNGVDASLHFDHVGSLASDFAQALLPNEFRRVMQQVGYRDGPETRVADARLRLAHRSGETGASPWHVDFQGTLHTDRASLNSEIDIKEIDGDFALNVKVEPGQTPQVAIDAYVQRMRVFGRELTDLSAPGMALSEDGRTLTINEARGDAYGGAVWADASIGIGDNLDYSANANFVGVSLRQLLADGTEATTVSLGNRGPRGSLYGSVQFSGLRGRPESRSGRGSARAIGSGLASVPLVLQLVQIMQLTVPLRGDMDHADVVFYIDGDRAVFERILLESTIGSAAALQLIGSGELDLRSFELATQFRSRSGMLLIRDIVGGLSDQLYVIEVTGTLAKPRARVVPLPGLTQPDRPRQQSSTAVLQDPKR